MLKVSHFVSIFLLGFATQVQATETQLTGAEISKLLSDVVLYSGSANQIFQKSGVTFYNEGGGQSQGNWNVQGNQYCSVWPPNPSSACFAVARDGDKVTFIAKSGKRTEMSLTK